MLFKNSLGYELNRSRLNWKRGSHVSWLKEDVKADCLTSKKQFKVLGEFGFIIKAHRKGFVTTSCVQDPCLLMKYFLFN
jgi:hypothetical protein